MTTIFDSLTNSLEIWRETIKLYAGLLEGHYRKDFIVKLIEKNILLGAEALTYFVEEENELKSLAISAAKKNLANSEINIIIAGHSVIALILLNSIDELAVLVDYFDKNPESKSKQLIKHISINSNKEQIISFIVKTNSLLPKTLFSEFLLNNYNFDILNNTYTLLKLKSTNDWEEYVRKLIIEPTNSLYFNNGLKLRNTFGFLKQIEDFEIIQSCLSIEGDVFRYRCFFDFYTYMSEKEELKKYLFQINNEFSLNILNYLQEANSISDHDIYLIIVSYILKKELYISNSFLYDLRKRINKNSSGRRLRKWNKKDSIPAFYQILINEGYLLEVSHMRFKVIKDVDLRFIQVMWSSVENNKLKRKSELSIGDLVVCTVTSLSKSHAQVILFGNREKGTLYIGDIANKYIKYITDELSIGQRLIAKIIGNDKRSGHKVSIKEVYKS